MKFLIISVLFLQSSILFTQNTELSSPSGKLKIQLHVNSSGIPEYRVFFDGGIFIGWSQLGVVIKGNSAYEKGLSFAGVSKSTFDETYKIIAGKSAYARNHYNQAEVTLNCTSDSRKKLVIILRAFDDGAAFRYVLKDDSPGAACDIVREMTSFNIPGVYTCWGGRTNTFHQNYECRPQEFRIADLDKVFENGIVTSKITSDSLILMPLTVQASDDLYFAITEAEIKNIGGLYLRKSSNSNLLNTTLAPDVKDNSLSSQVSLPFESPWRVIMVGTTPGELIESNIISNLNPPCAIDDVSWIKPGKSAWEWWALSSGYETNFGYGINDKTYKSYIDFASANGLEYVTIDAGWYGAIVKIDENDKKDLTKTVPEIHIEEIVKYAASKNVGVIVWSVWYHLRDQMEEAMSYFSRIGIKGIKVDLMDRDDHDMVDFVRKAAETAAKYRLLINFHGTYKPDGLCRTYPNAITREAVLGNEHAKWDPNYPNPDYNLIIPFTRMLAGALDYTPGSMRNMKKGEYKPSFVMPSTFGTRTQQLAMFVVFESPLQFLCDSPPVYEQSIGFDFLRHVPASWDSTIVLDAKIGEYIVIARKKGSDWYVGAMTNWSPRDISINFDFLGGSSYNAEVYSDTENNYSNCSEQNTTITGSTTKTFHLASGGGLVMRLKEK